MHCATLPASGLRARLRPWARRILGPAALAALLLSGCASGAPSLDDPGIAKKLDLRLRTALQGSGWSESLGAYIRVAVRMKRKETEEDRQALEAIGHVGAWLGKIVTLTLSPQKVVELATLPQVEYIELETPNVPMPVPPPPERPER